MSGPDANARRFHPYNDRSGDRSGLTSQPRPPRAPGSQQQQYDKRHAPGNPARSSYPSAPSQHDDPSHARPRSHPDQRYSSNDLHTEANQSQTLPPSRRDWDRDRDRDRNRNQSQSQSQYRDRDRESRPDERYRPRQERPADRSRPDIGEDRRPSPLYSSSSSSTSHSAHGQYSRNPNLPMSPSRSSQHFQPGRPVTTSPVNMGRAGLRPDSTHPAAFHGRSMPRGDSRNQPGASPAPLNTRGPTMSHSPVRIGFDYSTQPRRHLPCTYCGLPIGVPAVLQDPRDSKVVQFGEQYNSYFRVVHQSEPAAHHRCSELAMEWFKMLAFISPTTLNQLTAFIDYHGSEHSFQYDTVLCSKIVFSKEMQWYGRPLDDFVRSIGMIKRPEGLMRTLKANWANKNARKPDDPIYFRPESNGKIDTLLVDSDIGIMLRILSHMPMKELLNYRLVSRSSNYFVRYLSQPIWRGWIGFHGLMPCGSDHQGDRGSGGWPNGRNEQRHQHQLHGNRAPGGSQRPMTISELGQAIRNERLDLFEYLRQSWGNESMRNRMRVRDVVRQFENLYTWNKEQLA
ncbi:uncharacterized protein BJ171DRAFT_485796 [Polychytrium aggregatum]|uniref:uncharacterized protein n=1 Tax=Polychytrium aggregatum TaxID=110093 RepID=UPI0022FED63C|nr:uncharacterized protein BJ171DRAFT_485796 [Polychytrium aggregatum]KAI9209229.1 hypothetical protein BJ171DRAFT_485796 [Polychytrium aggregatum]